MEIKLLRIKDFKKIKEVEITPEDNVIVIGGNNGSGKTSVLDAIACAIQGRLPIKEPIRKGEKRAEILVELDDMIIERIWTTNSNSYLKAESKNGEKYNAPQKMLDAMIGKLTFDPLEFTRIKEEEQGRFLLNAIGMADPLEVLERKYKEIFEARTATGRVQKMMESQLEGMTKPEEDPESWLIDTADLITQYEKASRLNVDLQGETLKRLQITKQIEELKRQLDDCDYRLETIKREMTDMPHITQDGLDLEKYKQDLAEAQAKNARIDQARKYAEKEEMAKNYEKEYQEKTEALEKIKKAKTELLKGMEMPVPGMEISEDGTLLLNKVPFTQASASEQLKASVAIAATLNPQIRIIRITDGSLLDDESMGIIEDFAVRNEYQVWIERVGTDKWTDIIMVDGEEL